MSMFLFPSFISTSYYKSCLTSHCVYDSLSVDDQQLNDPPDLLLNPLKTGVAPWNSKVSPGLVLTCVRYSRPGGTPTGTAAGIPTGAGMIPPCSGPETGPGWYMTGGGPWL